MRVLILFDGGAAKSGDLIGMLGLRKSRRFVEADIFRAVRSLGHHTAACCVHGDVGPVVACLEQFRPDIVFNCVEAVNSNRFGEAAVAALLELLGFLHTGAGFSSLLACKQKHLVHGLLSRHGISTPAFLFWPRSGPEPDLAALSLPVIVKPASRDASDFISLASFARTAGLARRRVQFLHQRDCDVVIEEFLPGRELYVGVLGNVSPIALVPRELVMSGSGGGARSIATYNVKWNLRHRERRVATYRKALRLESKLSRSISDTALRAYRLLGIEGCARFDMKLCPDGRLYILDINPNPPISRHDEFVLAARHSGITYERLVATLLSLALERRRDGDLASGAVSPAETTRGQTAVSPF